MSAVYLVGEHPQLGPCFACIDPAVRFTAGRVEASRLGALLAPFPDTATATAAMIAAGARIDGGAA